MVLIVGRLGGFALLLALWLALRADSAAAHHVRAAHSEPEPGARLAVPPQSLLVELDQPVEMPGSGLLVTDATGTRVDRGGTTADPEGRALLLRLPRLPPGDYTATWRVTSKADGEFNEGSFPFTLVPDLALFSSEPTRLGGLAIVLATLGALGVIAGARPDR